MAASTATMVLQWIMVGLQVIICIPIMFFAIWWDLLSTWAVLTGMQNPSIGGTKTQAAGMIFNTLLLYIQTFCIGAILTGITMQIFKKRTTHRTMRYEITKSVLATVAYVLLLVNPVLMKLGGFWFAAAIPVILFFYPAAALAWTLHKRECAAKERNEQRFYEFDLEDDAEDVELLSRDGLKHHRLTETEA